MPGSVNPTAELEVVKQRYDKIAPDLNAFQMKASAEQVLYFGEGQRVIVGWHWQTKVSS